ncbi:hypothetical protein NFI96_000380 [Prochilodus magdalenae]|nr:hypothetical protein NFI96_000380 [Prochilodus magdalenae]
MHSAKNRTGEAVAGAAPAAAVWCADGEGRGGRSVALSGHGRWEPLCPRGCGTISQNGRGIRGSGSKALLRRRGGLVEEFFCRFGLPEELHSDQGRNFESHVLSEVCAMAGNPEDTDHAPASPE